MKWGTGTYDAQSALRSLGGERLHPKYMPGASAGDDGVGQAVPPGIRTGFRRRPRLATAEIGPGLASLEEIKRVDALTDAAIWVVKRHGAITRLPRPARPDPGRPRRPGRGRRSTPRTSSRNGSRGIGQPLAGFYCWCYAGKDQVTRGALVLALRKLIDQHFPDLPFFGRDTTEAGARIMRHLGFFPFDATPHLFWRCCSVMDENAA